MKGYDKEKLHEYAKELFALCLEKGLDFIYDKVLETINVDFYDIREYNITHICEKLCDYNHGNTILIWELIEKVKQL